jgi:hypothetical protein
LTAPAIPNRVEWWRGGHFTTKQILGFALTFVSLGAGLAHATDEFFAPTLVMAANGTLPHDDELIFKCQPGYVLAWHDFDDNQYHAVGDTTVKWGKDALRCVHLRASKMPAKTP